MRPVPRLLARLSCLVGFVLALTGWLEGLLLIDATASSVALLLATTCGLAALGRSSLPPQTRSAYLSAS